MPRKSRVQFPGAIYHIVTRGDGRRELFHDEFVGNRLVRLWRNFLLNSR